MTGGFRYEPSTLGADVLHRPRLVGLLAGRFTHRVTLVTAAAGYGKSTALALALQNNALDPRGTDLWLAAVHPDTDPEHLLAGIAHVVGVEPSGAPIHVRRRIVDALWHRAPDDVCLIVDDAHRIESDVARHELRLLVETLPTNAHVVLAGRHGRLLPVARLRAAGELLEIGEAELALDDGELRALVARHDGQTDEISSLPRHAATARLKLLVGDQASADFMWEEVLSTIDPDRLADLAKLSVLDEFDDELVQRLTDGRYTAATLVLDLPLVDALPDGAWRFHALLRRALGRHLEEGVERKTLSVAGDIERGRGRFAASIRLHERADDPIAVLETSRQLLLRPILRHTIEDVLVARRSLESVDRTGPVAVGLDALHLWVAAAGQSAGVANDLVPRTLAAAAAARAAGDTEIEAGQLYMAIQLQLLEHLEPDAAAVARLTQLASSGPRGELLWATTDASLRRRRGDVRGALAALEVHRRMATPDAELLRTEQLCDLGRPEMVALGMQASEVTRQMPNAQLMTAFGMWLRGEAPPELAEPVVAGAIPNVIRRGFDVASLSILGVGAVIATMAGDRDAARRRVDQTRALATAGIARSVELWADVAAAALAAERDGEDAAAVLLDPELTGAPYGVWPDRPHLMILSLLYVVRPEAREMLDRCALGPSLTVAVEAGRAVLAARGGELAPAAALPWDDENLLRANVLPCHLAELACAAIAHSGSGAVRSADALLRRLPHLHEHLTRVARHMSGAVADTAQTVSGGVVRAAPCQLHTRLFGRVVLLRDGETVTDSDFERRAKVRELWAYLVEHRQCTRSDVVAALWPGHEDETRALGNLRSSLATLQRVLEPDRPPSGAPYFLRAEGDRLLLDRCVTTDVGEFERLVADARDADVSAVPARSLALHRKASELYRGDYLEFLDTGWATLTRIRLQTLAIGSMCRVAELLAARGEPEEALPWAQRALVIDPLAERALSALLSSLVATGAVTPARRFAREATERLAAAGLSPGSSLRRMIARLG